MSANLTVAIVAGALVACGVYLLLERSLTRILLGVMVMSNGVNLLFLVASGPAGRAPFVGADGEISDPLPQAMVLTFFLGLANGVLARLHRSLWPAVLLHGAHNAVATVVVLTLLG